MSSSVSAPIIDKCANCGKGEENCSKLQKCGACLSVKYCSRECQATHRPQHKKACKKRAAELYDEKLFADPPPREECPICMLPLPISKGESFFKVCCGKTICKGCIRGIFQEAIDRGKLEMSQQLCPFCRKPFASTAEEELERTENLIKLNNAYGYNNLGTYFNAGSLVPQDYQKANELWQKAGELGCAESYFHLGVSYQDGEGVERDTKKSKHYYELAAMMGDVKARHNLGAIEAMAGNQQRALKHFVIAAKNGDIGALESVKQRFKDGYLTRDEYANILRVHLDCLKEMKSDARDEALL